MLKELIQKEPWRIGQGRPYNALDPTWEGDLAVCEGEAVWDIDNKWWFCKTCGHCSCWSQTRHYKAEHPATAYQRNLNYFYKKKKEQGLTVQEAELQALHVMSAVLKAAAMLPPSELRRLVDENILER
jgi:hypothetical protein